MSQLVEPAIIPQITRQQAIDAVVFDYTHIIWYHNKTMQLLVQVIAGLGSANFPLASHATFAWPPSYPSMHRSVSVSPLLYSTET